MELHESHSGEHGVARRYPNDRQVQRAVQRALRELDIEHYNPEWVAMHRSTVLVRLRRRATRKLLPWKVLQHVATLLLMPTGILLVKLAIDSLPLEGRPWLFLAAAAVLAAALIAALFAVHRWFHSRYERRLELAKANATWRTYELERYPGTVPDTFTELVAGIRKLVPEAEFEVEAINEPVYMMLTVRTVTRRYVIALHGSPNCDD